MKVKIRAIAALALAVLMIVGSFAVSVSAAENHAANRFNVCFVLDSTHSMLETDPEKLRYDATNLFLGLLANEGNNVGTVIFSGGVIKETPISPVNGAADKNKTETELQTPEKTGQTTIGIALNRAVEMLKTQGDPALKSVVILLSDGQPNKDDKDYQDEYEATGNAKAEAAMNGIKVYTVALNADGNAACDTLEGIAKATNGTFREVTKADDLNDVYKDFYQMIFSSGGIEIPDTPIPSDGVITQSFDVPGHGVEEVNIIIASDSAINNLTLTKPDGSLMSESEVKAMTTDAKRFSITKIIKPEGGTWTLNGKGTPGTLIKINMIFNDNLSLETEKDPQKDLYSVNDRVTVTGYILENGTRMSSGYDEYTAKLVPDDANGREIPMTVSGNSFVGEVTFDGEGTFAYHMELTGTNISKSTDAKSLLFQVGNVPPVVADGKEHIEEHITVIPFITKDHEIDLSEAASDPDGGKLTFDVTSSTFKDTTYEINGDKLIIKDFYDSSKGVCFIRVTDDKGSYADFDVTVSMTNVGIIALIVFGGIVILVAAAVVFLIYFLGQKKFMGMITVRNLETGASSTQQKNKGHINLSAFQIGNTGFDGKARFQASGKSFIYFMNSKPVLTDSTVKKEKRITILNRNETRIYSDDTRTRGISVTFDSFVQM